MNKRFEMRAKGLNTGNWYYGTYFEERPFTLSAFSSEKELTDFITKIGDKYDLAQRSR